MNGSIKGMFDQKLGLGRVALPLWMVGLAGVLTAAAAEQAVGPVLTGSTSGSVNLTVEQAITLDTDLTLGNNPTVSSADDSVTTRNDEGTAFTVAAELNVGQQITTTLFLQNDSGADAAAVLELNVPAGIDVELTNISDGAEGTTVVSEAQLSRNTWLVVVKSTAGNADNDGVRITIEPKDDLKPGFYTITGRLVQTSGG